MWRLNKTIRTAINAVAIAALVFVIGGLGHHFGSTGHIRRKIGQEPLAKATCLNCHFVSTERLPWAKPRPHHDAPAGLALSPQGTKLYIALDDRDEVAEADVSTRQVLRRVKVPGGPFGLTMHPEGRNLFVTCRNGDRLAVLDLPSLKEIGSIPVGMGPVAAAFCHTGKGDRLVVANSMSDDISVLALSPLQELTRPAAGREPFAVTVTADGSRVLVANRLVGLDSLKRTPSSEITVLDPATTRVLRRDILESAHLSEGASVVPGRPWTLVPLVKVRNQVPITQVANGWVMSSGLAVTDSKSGGVVQLPLDEANDYFSDPSAVVVDPAGRRAFISSGGSDVVSVVDLEKMAAWLDKASATEKQEAIYDLSLSPEYVVARIPTKRNPRQMVISADGSKLFVAERLEDSVLVTDARTLAPLGRIVLGDGGLDDPIRRGERVFTTSAYTFQHQFTCRSCHPDGHVDGLSYDFDGDGIGDNLLDNRSLQGVAGTAPFKWNGKNASLEIQCGPRFAKVLMRTEPFPPKQLNDLTTFIKSLPPPRVARHAAQKLTPAEERGRAIFFATKIPSGQEIPVARRCVTCHPPPLYTVRLPFNVGTKGPYDTTEAFDVPHLLGVSDTAPYLHDGRAQSLEELWTIYNTNDMHGVSSYMNKIQLNDLIEFLKTL
jgi:DNA-binding beta-propeller fold protein YncE